ncbi:hypothetical protein TNCV_1437131 [Trichonephila clavipes]|nr:hypothetical protein TNCV_1437131 [Trichonephila clavipes]
MQEKCIVVRSLVILNDKFLGQLSSGIIDFMEHWLEIFALGDHVCILQDDSGKLIQVPSLLSDDIFTSITSNAHMGRNPLKYTWFINLPEVNVNALCEIGISIANGLES